jgi:hypothetical protein
MLEGDGLVCVVVHVGVPEVREYSQLSRHCLKNREINQSDKKKATRIAKKGNFELALGTYFSSTDTDLQDTVASQNHKLNLSVHY